MDPAVFDYQMWLYIREKVFDQDIVDVVPWIIANVIKMDIIIKLEEITVNIPVTICNKVGYICILRESYPIEHYSGIKYG